MPNGPQKSYVSRIEQASGIQVWRQTGVFAHDDLSAAECRCDMSGYAYRPMKLSIFLQGLRARARIVLTLHGMAPDGG